MKSTIYLLVLICHTSYTNNICNQDAKEVQYTVYNYVIDVTVYQCQIMDIACEKSVPKNDIVKYCVSYTYDEAAFSDPDCHRGINGEKHKVKLILSTVKANLREDSIIFDNFIEKYSSGKFIQEENVTKVWKPEKNFCGKSDVIYNGPADVWSFRRDKTQRYVQGRISHSQFTLELVKETDTCEKKLWKTNRYGIYVSESKNSTTVIKEDVHRIGDEDMELVCDLTTTLKDQKETETGLRRNFYYMTAVAAVFIVWLVATSIFRLTTNYRALKRKKTTGFNLLRALSTTVTIYYLREREQAPDDESPEVVHDYECIDYIASNKINK